MSTYERIDKGDGSRQEMTREQVAERISKYFSLVDEEIERMNAGHVINTEFAWYQKKFVPGLRGMPSQQERPDAPDEEKESYVVNYGDRFYENTADAVEAYGEFGPEVCAREMFAERAMYMVLKAEGMDVPEPDELAPDVLGALIRLHSEAAYLEQRFWSGDNGPRQGDHADEMRLLYPRIHEALGSAGLVIGRLRDEAVKTPKLLDQRARRETILFERLRLAITSWMLSHDLMTEDVAFYTRAEWALRCEQVGRNSVLTMTFEGSTLYHILNDTFDTREPSGRLEGELRELLDAFGYHYELGYTWCLSLYPN